MTAARRPRFAALAMVLAVCAAGMLAGPAQAEPDVDVVVEPGGREHFAFICCNENNALGIRERGANGTWDAAASKLLMRECSRQADLHLLVDSAGNETLVWNEFNGCGEASVLFAQRRAADGTLDPVRVTVAEDIDYGGTIRESIDAALDGDGNVMMVWTKPVGNASQVQSRRWLADGTLTPVENISGTYYRMQAPQLELTPAGDAIIAWERLNPRDVQTRRRSAGGALGNLYTLSPAAGDAQGLALALAADGTAHFAWQHHDGSRHRAKLRTRKPNGTLGAIVDVSAPGEDVSGGVAIATEPDSDAVVVYGGTAAGAPFMRVRHRSRTGALSAPNTLTTPAPAFIRATNPRVVVDRSSNAVVTWLNWRDHLDRRVAARRRLADGTLGSGISLGDDIWSHALGVNSTGTATLAVVNGYHSAWTRRWTSAGTLSASSQIQIP